MILFLLIQGILDFTFAVRDLRRYVTLSMHEYSYLRVNLFYLNITKRNIASSKG